MRHCSTALETERSGSPIPPVAPSLPCLPSTCMHGVIGVDGAVIWLLTVPVPVGTIGHEQFPGAPTMSAALTVPPSFGRSLTAYSNASERQAHLASSGRPGGSGPYCACARRAATDSRRSMTLLLMICRHRYSGVPNPTFCGMTLEFIPTQPHRPPPRTLRTFSHTPSAPRRVERDDGVGPVQGRSAAASGAADLQTQLREEHVRGRKSAQRRADRRVLARPRAGNDSPCKACGHEHCQ